MGIKANTFSLRRLLELTQRKQNVGGKAQEQVIACVLRYNDGYISTTSLVRDGKTSLGRFVIQGELTGDNPAICIPDINRFLGVLSSHGNEVTVESENTKLRIKSGKKQTTLAGGMTGLAFPHSPETIGEWEAKSVDLAGKLDLTDGAYIMRDGSKRMPIMSITVEAVELFEGLRCDNMNNQKLNRYTFDFISVTDSLVVSVGDELKGRTLTEIEYRFYLDGGTSTEAFEVTFEGGLDNILKPYSGDCTIHFLDFRPEGQGIRAIFILPDDSWVFQAGVLD